MSLTGVWLNELNSIMVLRDPGDGSLSGKYRSIVGRDPNIRDLAGRTSSVEQGKQLLGFAVCFQIADPGPNYGHASLCTWCGWARDSKIMTHWTLTVDPLNKKDEWSATLIGEDEFEKVLDAPDESPLQASTDDLAKLLATVRRQGTK
jgi:hypothetical protein